MFSSMEASNIVAIGDSALHNNGIGANLSNDESQANTAVGSKAFKSNTKGKHGTAIGGKALMKNTTGFFNTAVGYEALAENITGSANAAFGQAALNKKYGWRKLSIWSPVYAI
ncbi:MAG: hypothetical protein IPN49_18700 [Saprospiraceae bacterium]|nr:hypothetical protein [Saprospiraceae bacterium]